MSCFGYRRELSKYEDVDEDELLASLSPEELAELEKELVDIDPDANVPIGLRQRDQTDKTPTGTFSREALMKYWENETRRLLENEIAGESPKLVRKTITRGCQKWLYGSLNRYLALERFLLFLQFCHPSWADFHLC